MPKDGPVRFQKVLVDYKTKFIKHTDRIIFIGCTRQPERMVKNAKILKKFWDKYLFFPYPDYATRLKLWDRFVLEQLAVGGVGGGAAGGGGGGGGAGQGLGDGEDGEEVSGAGGGAGVAGNSGGGGGGGGTGGLDLSTLAVITDGFSAGSIENAIKKTLTAQVL